MTDSTASVPTEAELIDEFNRDMAVWESMRADPTRFFGSRSTWPKHLSMRIATHSTWNWAARFVPEGRYHPEGEKGAYHYSNAWPLPVGRRALERHQAELAARHTVPYHGEQIVLYDAMPFDGDELAGWILGTWFGATRLECFGLTHLHVKHPDGLEVYTHDEMAVRVTSPGRISEDALALAENVRTWWHTLTGITATRGRPPGSRDYSPAEIRSLVKIYVHDQEPEDVKLNDFLERHFISESSWKRYMAAYGLRWPKLVQEARSNY
jgi:hypothetical protein